MKQFKMNLQNLAPGQIVHLEVHAGRLGWERIRVPRPPESCMLLNSDTTISFVNHSEFEQAEHEEKSPSDFLSLEIYNVEEDEEINLEDLPE